MTIFPLLALMVVPQATQVEAVLQAEIGPETGLPEAEFRRVSDLAADADGAVYIVDQMADRVVVFDSDGNYVRTLGQSGRGLGELSRPMRIDIRGDVVTVLNPSGVSNSYSRTGELLKSLRLPFGAQVAARLGEDRYVVTSYGGIGRADPVPIESLLLVESEAVDTLLVVPSSDMLYRGPSANGSLTTSLCRLAYFVGGDDTQIWVASGEEGTLTEWRPSNGTLVPGRSANLAEPGVPLPDSARTRELSRAPRQFDPQTGDLYLPPVLSSFCGLEATEEDVLWIRLGSSDGRELWRAIDTENLEATRELRAPEGVTIRAFSGDLAYGVRVDDARVTRVSIYRIE